ncbi:MAG: hypothetical protein M1833_000390 [Piccolia ochrophora]|nr:MAG: hypothetical protein M1833_000390 [Piccolia ochrophora]
MLEPRLFSGEPPRARTATDDKPTLLVAWWCTIFAITIIIFRIAGRFIRTERLFREDKIMALAIVPLMCRMALVHVVLIWGTNNVLATQLTPEQISHREMGSKLVLASRISYAAALWVQKFSITEFFKERLIANVWRRSYEVALQGLRWFLLATFACVVIATLAECHPFAHYWQVVPDPGPKCRQGYAQLLTMGTVNVLTDLLLVGFPIPIVVRSYMPVKRKISLVLLFSLSLVPIAFTVYRVETVIDQHGSQQTRSLWASAEILAVTAVSNAIVLGSFVRDRGPKKMKFKFGSATDSLSRPSTRREIRDPFWGSDEDLVRGLGLSVDPELRSIDSKRHRPAPAAPPGYPLAQKSAYVDLKAANWHFPPPDDTDRLVDVKMPEPARSPGEMSIHTPRRVSFFDVGGLLEDGSPALDRCSSPSSEFGQTGSTQMAHNAADGSRRKGSSVLLQDIGGLLKPQENLGRGPSQHAPTLDVNRTDHTAQQRQSSPTRRPSAHTHPVAQEPQLARADTVTASDEDGVPQTPNRFHYPDAYRR